MLSEAHRSQLLIALLVAILIATGAVFSPTLFNKFVDDWDDADYVLENKVITSLSAGNIAAMFTRPFAASYCPLAILSYAIEYRIVKNDPFLYHFTNYILHLLTVSLIFIFIYSISGNARVTFLTTLLFALHPIHVESVAWISERKDLLCAFFYMLSLIAYKKHRDVGGRGYYILCFISMLCSLLSKGMAVTIPLILLLIDYLDGRKVNRESVVEKWPFFVLAAVGVWINFHTQSSAGAMTLGGDFWFRAYFFSKAIPFYLSKTVIPINLSAIYPYNNLSLRDFPETYWNVAIMVGLASLAVLSTRYTRKIMFGGLFLIVMLIPVLKIVPLGDAFVADRYMYLPSIGFFYLFVVITETIYENKYIHAMVKIILAIFLSVYVIFISTLTWQRCHVWKDTESLFRDVARQYPGVPLVNNSLGVIYAVKGDHVKAMRFFTRAIFQKTHPKVRSQAEHNLNVARTESIRNGVPFGRIGPEEDMRDAMIANQLGMERLRFRSYDDAIGLFEEAVKINPAYAQAFNNLGYAYFLKGNAEKAIASYKKALLIDPFYDKARANLETALNIKRDLSPSTLDHSQ